MWISHKCELVKGGSFRIKAKLVKEELKQHRITKLAVFKRFRLLDYKLSLLTGLV